MFDEIENINRRINYMNIDNDVMRSKSRNKKGNGLINLILGDFKSRQSNENYQQKGRYFLTEKKDQTYSFQNQQQTNKLNKDFITFGSPNV